MDPGDHGVRSAGIGDKSGTSGDRVRAEEGRDRAREELPIELLCDEREI